MRSETQKMYKRLLWVGGASLVLSTIAGGVYLYTQRTLRNEYTREKVRAIEIGSAGEAQAAIHLLGHYLHRYPEDAEALAAYANFRPGIDPQADETLEQTAAALKHLCRLEPGRDEWRRRLLRLYVTANIENEALRSANLILSTQPNDLESLRVMATTYGRQGEWLKAQVAGDKWVAASKFDLDAMEFNLRARHQAGASAAEIVQHAADRRKDHPNIAKFELIEAIAIRLVSSAREPTITKSRPIGSEGRSAIDWLRAAASHPPLDDHEFTSLADEMDRQGMFAESLALFKARVNRDRTPLVRRLWESGRYQEVIDAVRGEAADGESLTSPLLGYWALALQSLGRYANTPLAILASRQSDPIAGAWLMVLQQNFDAPAISANVKIATLIRAFVSQPDEMVLHVALADALAQAGETDLASQQLRLVVTHNLHWALPAARLAEISLDTGNIPVAMQMADEARRRGVSTAESMDLKLACLYARVAVAADEVGMAVDRKELPRLIRQIQEFMPGEPYSLHLAIASKVRDGDSPAAGRMLSAALTQSTDMTESTLLEYADISRIYGLDLEEASLTRSEQLHGMSPRLAYTKAVYWLDHNNPQLAREMFDRQITAETATMSEWRLQQALFLEVADDPATLSTWQHLCDDYPQNIEIQHAVLRSQTASSNRALVDRAIERMRGLEGDWGIRWMLSQARQRLDDPTTPRRGIEETGRLLTHVVDRCPDAAEAHRLLARTLKRMGRDAQAQVEMELASTLYPGSWEIQFELVRMLISRGYRSRVDSMLEHLQSIPSVTPILLSRIAYLEELNGSLDKAERLYRRSLALDPQLAAAKNNLAMVIVKKGSLPKLSEAMDWAVQATIQYPQNAAFFDTLAAAQCKAAQYDPALRSLDIAIALPQHDPAYDVRRLTVLVAAGRESAAREALAAIEHATQESLAPELRAEIRQAKDRLSKSRSQQSRAN